MVTTKSEVRSDFAYARKLMQRANELLKDKTITDFSESSEIGQIANELVASVSTFQQYLDEKREAK